LWSSLMVIGDINSEANTAFDLHSFLSPKEGVFNKEFELNTLNGMFYGHIDNGDTLKVIEKALMIEY
jgi:hypothetical protein